MRGLEADLLGPKIVKCAHKQACAAQQQHTESDLNADGKFAETLRAFEKRAGILTQRVRQIGAKKVKDRSNAEEQWSRQTRRRA